MADWRMLDKDISACYAQITILKGSFVMGNVQHTVGPMDSWNEQERGVALRPGEAPVRVQAPTSGLIRARMTAGEGLGPDH